MLNMIRYCALSMVAAAAIMLAGGCGASQPAGHAAVGKVTYKGKPVPRGSILLSPDSSKGHTGPAISASIVDGTFDSSQAKQRLTSGAYRVRINGFDGNAQPDRELPLGQQMFAEYTTTIEVTDDNAGDLMIEVKP